MLITELIKLDTQAIYKHFNATKQFHFNTIDRKLVQYREELVSAIYKKLQYNKGSSLVQCAHFEFDRLIGDVVVYGHTTNNGKSKRISLVQAILSMPNPPYDIEVLGNSLTGKITLMKLNFDIQAYINSNDSLGLLEKIYKNIDMTDTTKVDLTPINMKSLSAFIKNSNALSYKDTGKMKEYIAQAQQIYMIADLTYGVLPQIISESKYGRKYYSGINLQSCHKIVRHAALGDHFQYDINAAVYAIKFSICAEHFPEKKFTYTSEYLEFKTAIRQRIAMSVFGKQSKIHDEFNLRDIKNAITAIGFGAIKTSNGFYDQNDVWQPTSLAGIFSYPAKNQAGADIMIVKQSNLDAFLNDNWVKAFMAEQKEMTELIIAPYKTDKFKEEYPFLLNTNNSFNKNRLMAFVFQSMERKIMDEVDNFMVREGAKVLLRVHDAIYVDKKIDLKELNSLLLDYIPRAVYNRYGALITMCLDEFNSYTSPDDYEVEHKAFIIKEEKRAQGSNYTPYKALIKLPSITQKDDYTCYDSKCDYGQTEYNADNDEYVNDMSLDEKNEHYRILGVNTSALPDFINKII